MIHIMLYEIYNICTIIGYILLHVILYLWKIWDRKRMRVSTIYVICMVHLYTYWRIFHLAIWHPDLQPGDDSRAQQTVPKKFSNPFAYPFLITWYVERPAALNSPGSRVTQKKMLRVHSSVFYSTNIFIWRSQILAIFSPILISTAIMSNSNNNYNLSFTNIMSKLYFVIKSKIYYFGVKS